MTTQHAPATEAGPSKPWYRTPHKIVLAVGIFMGLFTMASGIIPQFTHWHGTSEISREVFEGIPGALQVAFCTVIPGCSWGGSHSVHRVRNWERGAPDRRATTPKNFSRRLRDFRAGAYMQTLLRDSAAGLMHSLIYFGFLVLLGVTTVLEIDHQLPEDLKFLHGDMYMAYTSSAISPAWCSSSASCGPCCAATCSARTASASRPSPSTPSSSACSRHRGQRVPRRGLPHRRDRSRATRSGASSAIRSASCSTA